ncbi:MAG: hypothetical protein JEZ07_00850 [Phycisphaerae bacterium]|nr:hypothetical protein [Phycisphaerae bacterium]
MAKIEEHSLKVLEFGAVKKLLANFATSDPGRIAVMGLYPSADANWVKGRLAETSQLRKLLEQSVRVPMKGIRDLNLIIDRVGKSKSVLEAADLLKIAETLEAATLLKQFFEKLDNEYLMLKKLAFGLGDFVDLVAEIFRCVDGYENVRDQASEKLNQIRRATDGVKTRIQRKYKALMSGSEMAKAVANDQFITRNGRAVILVKANYRHLVQGVVVDHSNTGNALYMEPHALVELSNELENLHFQEQSEISRILWELTRLVLDRKEDIIQSIKILGLIDLTYAKAKFSMVYNMNAPEVAPGQILKLRKARHPLLLALVMEQNESISNAEKEIVPIDVRLGEDFDMLLLTGPNTGGKTITLKTIGLLALMAQSGMHIPAWADSCIPIYKQVFADIGDEQSIAQSLSTFSAHVKQIVGVLNRAGDDSLVLLDELGAGTDPNEGAALGQAILQRLLDLKAKTIVTTHLGQLKNFAFATDRVENGSVQFDVETLRPTYELLIGMPGSSNALAIVSKLGMPKKVVSHARKLSKKEDSADNDLINQLQNTRVQTEQLRDEAQAKLDAAHGMQVLAAERLDVTAQQRDKLQELADQEVDKSMRQVRKAIKDFGQQMQNAPKQWAQKALELNEKIYELAASTPLALRQQAFVEKIRKGDTVWVLNFKREGIVVRLHRKRQSAVIRIEGKEVEIPFTELWEPSE